MGSRISLAAEAQTGSRHGHRPAAAARWQQQQKKRQQRAVAGMHPTQRPLNPTTDSGHSPQPNFAQPPTANWSLVLCSATMTLSMAQG